MKPKALVFFSSLEDKTDEVKAAFREFVARPGQPVEVYVVPYSNRFVVIFEDPQPGWGKDPLAQTLRPFIKESFEFIDLEPVASRE